MSANIDENIVQMRFENTQFEQGVSQSLTSIDKLKQGLNFSGASKGLESLGAAAGNVVEGLQAVQQKFSFLDVLAYNVFNRVSNSVLNAASNIARMVTGLDSASAGLAKYGEKMTATKTITTATGESLETVNKVLDDLNWFTDETSYDFTQMTGTIGKFTAAGEKLEDAKEEVEGIALWAAESGQNAQTASRVMYQLSQAYGKGKFALQDWMSVETANMATQKIQNQLIEEGGEAAKAAIAKHGGFRDSLRDGWLTTKVFNNVMKKYTEGISEANYENGKFTGGVTELSEHAFRAAQEARTFTDVINALKDAVSTGWMHTFEYIFGNQEESSAFFTDMANELIGISDKFTEARNSVLEAWNAFGGRSSMLSGLSNLATVFDSNLDRVGSNIIEKIFPKKTREEQLKSLKGLSSEGNALIDKIVKLRSGAGGMDSASISIQLESLYEQLDNLDKASPLLRITKSFENFGEKIKYASDIWESFTKYMDDPSKQQGLHEMLKYGNNQEIIDILSNLRDIFQGFGSAGHIAINAISGFFDAVKPLLDPLKTVGESVLNLFGALGRLTGAVDQATTDGDTFYKVFKSIVDFILPPFVKICDLVADGIDWLASKIDGLSPIVKDFFSGFKLGFDIKSDGKKVGSFFKNIGEGIGKFVGAVGSGTGTIISEVFKGIGQGIGAISIAFGKFDIERFLKIVNGILGVSGGIGAVKGIINVVKMIKDVKSGNWLANSISSLFKPFSEIGENINGKLKADTLKSYADVFKSIAIALVALAVSLLIISSIKPERLESSVGVLSILLGEIVGVYTLMKLVNKHLSGGQKESKGLLSKITGGEGGLVALCFAVIELAKAVQMLGTMDTDQVTQGMVAMSIILWELFAVAKLLTVTNTKGFMSKSTSRVVGGLMGLVAVAIAIRIVVASVKALGQMDTDKMIQGLIGAGIILTALTAVAAILSKKENHFKATNMLAIGVAFQQIAIALVIVSAALKIMATMNPDQMTMSLIGMTVILAGMTAVLAILSSKSNKFSGVKMIAAALAISMISGALILVASSLKILSTIDPQSMAISLAGMLAALSIISGSLMLLSRESSHAGKMLLAAVAIDLVAGALVAISGSLKILSTIDPQSMAVSLAGMLSVLSGVAVALLMLSGKEANVGKMLVAAVAIDLVAGALVIISGSLALLSGIDPESLASAMAVLAVALGSISIALGIIGNIGPKVIVGAAAIAVVAIALNLLIPPITAFSNLSLPEVASALITLAGALGIIVGALIIVGSSAAVTFVAVGVLAAIAGVMFVLGAAMKEGATAIATLVTSSKDLVDSVDRINEMDSDTAAKSFDMLSNAYMDFGKAIGSTGFWAEGKASGIVALVDSTDNLVDSVRRLGEVDSDKASLALNALQTAYSNFATVINGTGFFAEGKAEALSTMAAGALDLSTALSNISAISESGLSPTTAASDISTAITIIAGTDTDTAAVKLSSISDSLYTFASNLSLINTTDEIGMFRSNFELLVADIQAVNVDGLTDLGTKMVNEITIGITNNFSKVITAFQNLISSLKVSIAIKEADIRLASVQVVINTSNAIRNQQGAWISAGEYLASGVAQGIRSKESEVTAAAIAIAEAASNAFKANLEINSPSKVGIKLGGYWPAGIAIGMERMTGKVVDAAENISYSAMSGMGYALKSMTSGGSINPISSSNVGLSPNSIGIDTSRLSGPGYYSIQNANKDNDANRVSPVTNTFIQNNYSPKELSRIDIYRQTKSLFSDFRGSVN